MARRRISIGTPAVRSAAVAGARTLGSKAAPLLAAFVALTFFCCSLGFAAPATAKQQRFSAQASVATLAVQQAQLTAADGGSWDLFGCSVALFGDTALVGAAYQDIGGNVDRGAAYVFVRSGGAWSQQAKLTALDGGAFDWFGHSVALSGDTALVGAPGRKIGANSAQGAAYVFVRTWHLGVGYTWSQQGQPLTASDGAPGDHFGTDVAISGDTALVGAPERTVGANAAQGAAYVYVRTPVPVLGYTWTREGPVLVASDGGSDDGFGDAVALDGSTAVVGAPDHQVGGNVHQGAAYAFMRGPALPAGYTWTRQGPALVAGDGAAEDHFGTAVAVSGTQILVGAPEKGPGEVADGAAYVFVRAMNSPPLYGFHWNQQGPALAPDDGATNDHFGDSVALSGDTALVGEDWRKVGVNANQGTAFFFTRSGSTWTQTRATLVAADGVANDQFGNAVALSGSTALVGAFGRKVGTNESQGAAYVFAAPPEISVTSPAAASLWPAQSTQWVTWALDTPVATGEFRVYLAGPSGGYANSYLPAVAFKTSYSQALKVTCPAGPGYQACVYWRPIVGSGSWAVIAKSAAFTVTPKITVSAPTASSIWAHDSTQTVRWTLTTPVSVGEFRVYLAGPSGGYANSYLPAVAFKTSYSQALKVTCPAGPGYQACVYWRPIVGSGSWAAIAKSAAFTVTP